MANNSGNLRDSVRQEIRLCITVMFYCLSRMWRKGGWILRYEMFRLLCVNCDEKLTFVFFWECNSVL